MDTTEEIEAVDTTGFYFDHDASKFKINITSIKIDDGERQGDLIHLTNYPLKKYCLIDFVLLQDSWSLHNPLHKIALHLTTIVIHLAITAYYSHFGINVSIACRAYVSYAVFLVTYLLNQNILENYDGRI